MLPPLGDAATLVALMLIPLAFLVPKLATALQMVMTTLLVLGARAFFLPALFLLQVTPTDFSGGNAAGMDVMLERFETITFFVGPFPVNANYVLLAALNLRVAFELFTRPASLRGVMSPLMLIGWLIALYVDFQISLLSRTAGAVAWTSPLRSTLVLAAFWYGAIMRRDADMLSAVVSKRLVWIALSWIGVSCLSNVWTSSIYFFYALLAAAGTLLSCDAKNNKRLIGAGLVGLSGLHALGLKYGSTTAIVSGRTIAFGSTLTNMLSATFAAAIAAGRCYLSPASAEPRRQRKLKMTAALTFAAVLTGLTVPPIIVPAMTLYTVEHDSTYGLGHDRALLDRVYYKLLVDRASVWRGAWQDILEPPYFIKPMPAMGKIIFNDGSSYKFPFGAHSLLLDCLVRKAWFSGLFCYIFMMLALWSSLTFSFAGRHPGVATLAIASAAVGIASSIGGSAVTNAWEGFLFLCLAGLAQAQLVSERSPQFATDLPRANRYGTVAP